MSSGVATAGGTQVHQHMSMQMQQQSFLMSQGPGATATGGMGSFNDLGGRRPLAMKK